MENTPETIYELAHINSPGVYNSLAEQLKKYVTDHNLITEFTSKGKKSKHVNVEGWQFVLALLGIIPKTVEVTDLSDPKKNLFEWLVRVDLIEVKTGKVFSTAFASCSNKESYKTSFDKFKILSMAQTRAIGKAGRDSLGWIFKLGGFEATPSEEMESHKPPTKDDSKKLRAVLIEYKNFAMNAINFCSRRRELVGLTKIAKQLHEDIDFTDACKDRHHDLTMLEEQNTQP